MLKFNNQQKTAASFFNSSFVLAAPEDWDSIGDGPTRTKVKEWLAAGNTPEPADPEPQVFPVVTMRQARLALHDAGLLTQVNGAVSALGGAVEIEWEYATTVERSSPLVASLATALNLSEQEIDALFEAAKTL
jgi:hypothetical protein